MKITWHSRVKAESLVPSSNAAMISISSLKNLTSIGAPRVPAKLKEGWKWLLRLEFDDFDAKPHKIQPDSVPFSREQAKQVHNFLDKIKGQADWLAIHCDAGGNRSPAIAKFAIEYLGASTSPPSRFGEKTYRALRGQL